MTSRSGCTSDPRGWETPLIRVTPGPRLMGLCPGEDGRLCRRYLSLTLFIFPLMLNQSRSLQMGF